MAICPSSSDSSFLLAVRGAAGLASLFKLLLPDSPVFECSGEIASD